MSIHLKITVPGDPVGAGRPRVAPQEGRRIPVYTPARSREWTKVAVEVFRLLYRGSAEDGPVSVWIDAVSRRPQRLHRCVDPSGLIWRDTKPDPDNVAKLVLDALVKARVIEDDARVVFLAVRSLYTEKAGRPRVEVQLESVLAPPEEVSHSGGSMPSIAASRAVPRA